MSGDTLELDILGLDFRWTVDIDSPGENTTWLGKYLLSSEFTFEGGQWCLMYSECLYDHRLALQRMSGGPHGPFTAKAHLVGTDRIVLRRLSSKKHRFATNETLKFISSFCENDIVRADPDFCEKRELRYLVELKTDDGIQEVSVATQTQCSIPADFELHCVNNLTQAFARLKDQGSDTDVEFRCEGRSFEAHGTVVCARSPAIASMLSSDMIEGRTRVIKIPDMTEETFEIFLGYIYSGTTPELTFELAWTLYESADQYAVLGLARRCSRYLVEQLSDENVCDVLVLADAHSDEGFLVEVLDCMVVKRIPRTATASWLFLYCEYPRLLEKIMGHYLKFFSSKLSL